MLRQPISYAFIEASIQNVFILVIDQNESSFPLESSIIRSFAQILYAKTYGCQDMIVTTYSIASEIRKEDKSYATFILRATTSEDLRFHHGGQIALQSNAQYVPYHIPTNQPKVGAEVSEIISDQLSREIILYVVDSNMSEILPYKYFLYSEGPIGFVQDPDLLRVLHSLYQISPSEPLIFTTRNGALLHSGITTAARGSPHRVPGYSIVPL